jgi:hypothetical protein
MVVYLQRKKDDLVKSLEEITNSKLYEVLTTYKDPLEFIAEVRVQFGEKITQLEKRTRINKK